MLHPGGVEFRKTAKQSGPRKGKFGLDPDRLDSTLPGVFDASFQHCPAQAPTLECAANCNCGDDELARAATKGGKEAYTPAKVMLSDKIETIAHPASVCNLVDHLGMLHNFIARNFAEEQRC